jgi:hypothetical protein
VQAFYSVRQIRKRRDPRNTTTFVFTANCRIAAALRSLQALYTDAINSPNVNVFGPFFMLCPGLIVRVCLPRAKTLFAYMPWREATRHC